MPNRMLKPNYWTDPKLRGLSANAKYLGAYLITNPHTDAVGAVQITSPDVAVDTGLDVSALADALSELVTAGVDLREYGTAKRKRAASTDKRNGYTPNRLVAAFAKGAGRMFALGHVESSIAIRLNVLQSKADKFGVTDDQVEAAGRYVLEREHWRTEPVTPSALARGNFLFDLLAKSQAPGAGIRGVRDLAQEMADEADRLEGE